MNVHHIARFKLVISCRKSHEKRRVRKPVLNILQFDYNTRVITKWLCNVGELFEPSTERREVFMCLYWLFTLRGNWTPPPPHPLQHSWKQHNSFRDSFGASYSFTGTACKYRNISKMKYLNRNSIISKYVCVK